jgi:pimeloyl-ACP methyl ester carboxylesterase
MAEQSPPHRAPQPASGTRTERDFLAAYDAVLAKWPVPVEPTDVGTDFGTTRVQVCGPRDGEPLVLLPGGGATSTVWFGNVAALSRGHRVYAVDPIADPGRGVPSDRPLRRVTDLLAWLDAVLAGLGLPTSRLAGHSYGGWLAMSYAIHAPHRISRLALLDPTDCFGGLGMRYRLRALPALARPSRHRMRGLLRWETAGRALDQSWLEVVCLGSELRRNRIVLPRRPAADLLRALGTPTLVVMAGRSRAHDSGRLAATARRMLPGATVTVLPGASHHSIPTEDSEVLNRELVRFLA